ncbi:hypothetical protein BZA05DRAFT_339266 [Tricharina praecox]|uniref:uncharacterized protein n=1 Tax=Tricharina praecox TaxID=43433 RepID=UPI00221EBAEC|nr:uncharacterized protein BZA05DRAFT_339266 [Tricharina praecox]KAI5849009.1 hypothetical protein BZA05DRAFT_339266 [Tricharina praecox]
MPGSFGVTVTVRSVYDYTPKAVDKLLNSYRSSCPYSYHVECRFNPAKQQFVLKGDGKLMEYAVLDFMDYLHQMTARETNKPNPEQQIVRSPATLFNVNPVLWTENTFVQSAPAAPSTLWDGEEGLVCGFFGLLFASAVMMADEWMYSLKQVWEPKVSQEDFSSMLNLEGNPTKLDQLKRLYDCAVSHDWGRRTVTIGANDVGTLEMVIGKLDRVAEFYNRKFTPILTHCVNGEDKAKFLLRFVSFANQSGRARTTYFDNTSKWNEMDLDRLYSIRLLEYDYTSYKHKSCRVETGLVHSAYKTPDHSDWAGYVFCTREASDQPTSSSQADMPLTFFMGPNQPTFSYQPSISSQSGLGAGLDLGSRPTDSDGGITESVVTRHPRERDTLPGTFLGTRPTDSEEDTSAPSTTTRRPRERVPAPKPAVGLDFGPPPVDNENQDTFGVTRRLRERVTAPKPIGVRRPVQAQKAEETEAVAEPATRTLRRTVNQKMPRPIHRPDDPETLRKHNSKKTNETLFHALEYARGWHGELKLEAKVGRLIFLDVPRKIVKQESDWQKWDSIVNAPAEDKIKSTFTRIMTTQHFDMEYIRDLKIAGGEELFLPKPISYRVTWEFQLEQQGKKRTLCVDGETFQATLYGDKKNFGAVNMANPLHSWDYRVELVGRKLMDINCDPFIKHIYDSIACTTTDGLPEVNFVVDGPSLVIKRVLLKCETRHSVYLERHRRGVPMELVITEVQETHMLSKTVGADKKYRACVLQKNKMRQNARLYYTCSIVPTEANALLKQNLDLDVGGMSDWSCEEVLRLEGKAGGLLLPSLLSVLNQVVAKLDDVGSTNSAFL